MTTRTVPIAKIIIADRCRRDLGDREFFAAFGSDTSTDPPSAAGNIGGTPAAASLPPPPAAVAGCPVQSEVNHAHHRPTDHVR